MSNFEAVLLLSPEISDKILLKELEDFKKQIENHKGKIHNYNQSNKAHTRE